MDVVSEQSGCELVGRDNDLWKAENGVIVLITTNVIDKWPEIKTLSSIWRFTSINYALPLWYYFQKYHSHCVGYFLNMATLYSWSLCSLVVYLLV